MNLPTTKPNDRDLDWYVRECEWLDDRNRVLAASAANAIIEAEKMRADLTTLRARLAELEAERTQFSNRAARLAAVEHELEEVRNAERLARVQLQAEREARK